MSQHRFTFSTGQKIVFWAIAFIIAWRFLHLPEMIDACMTFLLAGAVPGTHIVLSPDAVIKITVSAAIAVVVLAITIPLIRSSLRHRNSGSEAPDPLPELQLVSEPVHTDTTAAERLSAQMYLAEAALLATVDYALPKPWWRQLLATAGNRIYNVVERGMPRVITSIVKTYVVLRPKIIVAWQHIQSGSERATDGAQAFAIWTAKKLEHLWRWMVPLLWEFDAWLEMQVRKYFHK